MKSVGIYPSDGSGCGMYRLIWPGNAVAATGKPVMVIPRPPQITVDKHKNVHGINVGSLEVVVFQRPALSQMSQVIPLLQERGIKVCIDMDDDLGNIHPRNPGYTRYDPKLSPDMNWQHAQNACDIADWITVTTPKLAERYGSHGRVTVIPNHVPQSYLNVKKVVNEVPVVGWAGWTVTHQNDLEQTRGAINMALVETGAKFIGYGDDAIFRNLQIKQRDPHELLAFTSIPDYPANVAKFDIGLVPLDPSPFNESKSWLKALEYCSLGVVPVVTPNPDNQRLIDLGAAIPATSSREWHTKVKELILDNELRQELSEHCRKIASDFTIEGNTNLWWNVWNG